MSSDGPQTAEARETARIEAFSDGVFAIAATLLVLDLKVPHDAAGGPGLLRALAAQWPAYLAFVTSFAFIGIMWINHHRLFTLIKRSDNLLLVFNGLLLLGVTFVPFPTAVLAEYIPRDGGHVAAAVYSGTYTVLAVFSISCGTTPAARTGFWTAKPIPVWSRRSLEDIRLARCCIFSRSSSRLSVFRPAW